MNQLMEIITNRRSVRGYQTEQIKEEALNAILEAGLYAPNAGNRQSAKIVVSQDASLNEELGKICFREFLKLRQQLPKDHPSSQFSGELKNAFYNAPTLLTLFSTKGHYNETGDCFVAAQNMMLMAHTFGVGSCLIARAPETFATVRGKEIQASWGIANTLEAKVFVVLGYAKDVSVAPKARKENRVIRV